MSTTGSRLPRGVALEGTVRGHGDLRVAGEVIGPIEIEGHLVIEEGGVVRGEIRARTITIAGTLEGNATALELVRLEPGARMTGDARAERVSAAQGALLKGRIRTSQERAQLERMRRTTGGTLLAPFSSSGSILAPALERSASELSPADRSPADRSLADRSLVADRPLVDRRPSERSTADRSPADRPLVDRRPSERSPADRSLADRSASGDVVAPTLDRLATEAVVARVTREAVIDGRDPATREAQAAAHAAQSADAALLGRPTQPLPERPRSEPVARASSKPAEPTQSKTLSEKPARAEMDRPPAPVMPAIGRRRAARRGAESQS